MLEKDLSREYLDIHLSESFGQKLDKQWKNRAIRTLFSALKIKNHLELHPRDTQAQEKLKLRLERLDFYINLLGDKTS